MTLSMWESKVNKKVEKEFLDLVNENPTLPIIYFVDSEVVGAEWSSYGADVSYVSKGECAYYNDRWFDDREYFKEVYYDKNDEKLSEKFGYHPFRNHWFSITEKELEKYLDEVADKYFHEAIVVNLGTIKNKYFDESPFCIVEGEQDDASQ